MYTFITMMDLRWIIEIFGTLFKMSNIYKEKKEPIHVYYGF